MIAAGYNDRQAYIDAHPEHYLQQDKSGRGYICPVCGSGSGEHGTGITTQDGKHYTCWHGCFTNADLVDIIGMAENAGESYPAKLTKACEVYGLDLPAGAGGTAGGVKPTPVKEKAASTSAKDYSAMYRKAASHPERFSYLLGRGISEDVQRAFNIGRLDGYHFAKDYQAPTCLIPVDKQHYTVRNIAGSISGAKARHKGKDFPLFNWAQAISNGEPIFVVEGEIDALSIIEAGGQAVALCSTSGKQIFVKAASGLTNPPPFILALDNDPAGESAANWILERMNAINAAADLYGDQKDANAALCADREAFIARVKAASAAAKANPPAPFENKPSAAIFGADSAYIIKEDGSLYYSYSKGEETKEQYLGDFYLQGLAAITKDDGIEKKEILKLLPVHNNQPLAAFDIGAEKFAGQGLAGALPFECRPAIGRSTIDRIRDSVRVQSANMKRETVYLHPGWRDINGSLHYLYCGGAIPPVEATVELPGGLDGRYTFPVKDSPDKFQTLLKWFDVAPAGVVYPLLAISFLAPLVEFFTAGGYAPGFLLFLLGKTQSQKSTLAALALSFFGDFDAMTLPASFNDTPVSLEHMGFTLKDALTVIDDYYPETNRTKAGSMNKTVDMLAAAYGDRQGKSRCNPDGTLKPGKPVRGMAIITGEIMPNSAQSRLARHLFVEIERGSVNLAVLSELQGKREQLAAVMRDYIAWLAPQADKLPERLRQAFIERRGQMQAKGRAAGAAAHLQVAFEMLLTFLLQANAITPEQAATHKAACKKELAGLAALHEQIQRENNPVCLFLDTLSSLLTSGAVSVYDYFDTTRNPAPEDNLIGYQDNDYYYLLPDAAYNAVFGHCAAAEVRFPIDKRELAKDLAEIGIMEPGKVQAARLKSIRGRNVRCWFIRRDKLAAYAETEQGGE